ncbi:hypothetical protein SLS60_007215 [Paraconiothyrium brasiliense]|uniref:Azaphilone pigments biosynthesis cluster protein L N-terminal domain-containing protein n=1 Tax=Paraconiothyrium brasiliense TaxID=300254 RepID=A0ABR3R8Z1_9PLEO
MGDPLSVVSAIIGIIAAAGKVAELLEPLVSSVKDAKNNAREIQDQVEESRAILQALQKLFDDLEQSPRRRRELIQIDQLRATLCDGIVIFSDLEPLVVQLRTSNESLRSRVQWARKRDQLEAFSRRLDRFKSSINTMLNILQWYVVQTYSLASRLLNISESDMDAAANRQELYNLTSQLLQSNRDLRRRLSLLERGPRDDGDSVHLQIGQRSSLVSIRSQIRAFEFERELKESWVYRKARRSTADASFRSSNALSHAWSALSDISLSDISAISVVALPISPDDLSNGHHYRQGQGQPGGCSSQQQGKELVIGPPTLLTSTYQGGLSPLASPSRGTIDPESFDESKTEKDVCVPQQNQANNPISLYPHTPSADESLRTPPLAKSPRSSLEGLDTAMGSIGDVRREKEDDGSDPVPLTELSNMEVSVSFSPAETLSQGSKTGGFTRFPREYMLAIVGGGRVGKSDLAVQVSVHQLVCYSLGQLRADLCL